MTCTRPQPESIARWRNKINDKIIFASERMRILETADLAAQKDRPFYS